MVPPTSVYFAALVSRLENTCASRMGSASRRCGSLGWCSSCVWCRALFCGCVLSFSSCFRVVTGLDQRACAVDHALNHCGEIDALLAQLELAARDAGDLEQIVQQQ